MKDIAAIRNRPGMYIGDTDDGSGLHNMVFEVVNNAVNEALTGHANRIEVVLNADSSCTVRDNGRGIPTEIHPEEGVSAAELIMTRLRTGGISDRNPYNVPGELHGVGVCVVNALSEFLDLRIWRNGKEHLLQFRHGDPLASLRIVGEAPQDDGKAKKGTEINFLPSPAIFSKTYFDHAILGRRVGEMALLKSGISITFTDKRGTATR